MAAANGVAYVPVVNLPSTVATVTAPVGSINVLQATGEMVAIDIASGKQLWATKLAQMPLGGATVVNDLVFTTTLTGEVVALSRKDGTIVWTAQLPAGSNATLAITGGTLLAGAGLPLAKTQRPAVVAYRLGAKGTVAPTTGAASTTTTAATATAASAAQAPAQIPARMPNTGAGGMSPAGTPLGGLGMAMAVLGVGGRWRMARRRTSRHPHGLSAGGCT